jgi:Zn finger protein HypA/HybF involved in hydrogenase expression
VAEKKTFYCLRCQRRFEAEHLKGTVVERSCPACGSNSVRLETEAAARAFAARD